MIGIASYPGQIHQDFSGSLAALAEGNEAFLRGVLKTADNSTRISTWEGGCGEHSTPWNSSSAIRSTCAMLGAEKVLHGCRRAPAPEYFAWCGLLASVAAIRARARSVITSSIAPLSQACCGGEGRRYPTRIARNIEYEAYVAGGGKSCSIDCAPVK